MSHRLRHHNEVVIDELRNPEIAKAYLEVALEEYELDGDLPFFLQALRNVAEAQGGITKLSEKTSLNRQNLDRVLSENGSPELRTISLILHTLGYRLSIVPAGSLPQ